MTVVWQTPAVAFESMMAKWQDWWKTLPDDERQQWKLDPFISVGPLCFDMSPGEVSRALNGVAGDSQRYTREAGSICAYGVYQEFGLNLYYREERLAGVAVHARLGPQVLADGVALTGKVPSVLEQWLLDRAETRRSGSECVYMGAGIPGSDSLGVWIDVQRAGDHLLTRPVCVSWETADSLSDLLPRRAWSCCDPS